MHALQKLTTIEIIGQTSNTKPGTPVASGKRTPPQERDTPLAASSTGFSLFRLAAPIVAGFLVLRIRVCLVLMRRLFVFVPVVRLRVSLSF